MGNHAHRKRLILFILCLVFIYTPSVLLRRLRKPALSAISDIFNEPFQVKIQPGLSKLINSSVSLHPFNGHYVYENTTFCSSVTNLTILVLVLSSATNFQRRQTVRQTWANETFYKSYGKVKALFLLGIVDNHNVQSEIDKEFKLYGDMVQGAFIDTYHNLTHKSTMGFKWATERCRNAKYVLKTDDDIVINLFKVFLNNILKKSDYNFHVYCHRQSTPVVRNNESKWFVEEGQFKGLMKYPTYCGGSFVMILNEVVPFIYRSLLRTPFFHIEDVLLYGFALNNIPNLKYKLVKNEDVKLQNVTEAINCLNLRKTQCPLFIFMTKTVDHIVSLWTAIVKIYNR